MFLQRWINKIAETLHNLEVLQIEIGRLNDTDIDHNVVELCRNNKNIKVLVFNRMVISVDSCNAIAENCKKLDVVTICFPMLKEDIYSRYFIFRLFRQHINISFNLKRIQIFPCYHLNKRIYLIFFTQKLIIKLPIFNYIVSS